MNEFRNLGIIEPIVKVIEEEKFQEPSTIQEKAIPLVLRGQDVIAGSATGSGKTLAFGAGIIKDCEKGRGIQSLILTPTRELAEQVAGALKSFSKYKPLNVLAVYGGVAIGPQISRLPHTDVVVGTPGRILDHIQRKTINLANIKILVLDEADRMFDMGFKFDVTKIISYCPRKKQTLLFSATITGDVFHLAEKYMHNPVEVAVESFVDPSKLTQVFYDVPSEEKFSLLVTLLKKEHPGLIMVFCNTQRNTDFVAMNLKANGIDAVAIHGGFSQAKRNKTMEDFHAKSVKVLVCTDVAARGLDIKGVSHIYNYDIPADDNSYVHRIGRTARAGKEGKAVNILSNRDYDNFRRALDNKKFNIQRLELPAIERAIIKFKGGGRFNREGRVRNFSRPGQGFRSGGNFQNRGPKPRDGFGRGFRKPRPGQRDSSRGRFGGSRNSPRARFNGPRDGLRGGHGGQRRTWNKFR